MGDSAENLEQKLDSLDLSIFDPIPSQSVPGDRVAWLKLQRLVRSQNESYTYLELGSHLGGSIQNHWLDPRCGLIYSIDKRPPRQPDDRGQVYEYENNSTERMLNNLHQISEEGIKKIVCFDSDAAEVDPNAVSNPPQLCFIDGEHTQAAVSSDFEFCLKVSHPNGLIALHDDLVIWPAIDQMHAQLRRLNRTFRSIKLGGSTFVFLLGESAQILYPKLIQNECDGEQFISRVKSKHRFERWVKTPIRKVVPAALRKSIRPLIRSLSKGT